MSPKWIVGIVTTLVTGLFVALFAYQNSSRTTDLSLNFGFEAGKFHLAEPVSVPLLMGICFLVGLVVGGGYLAVRVGMLKGQLRRLEQRVALEGEDDQREWR